jgi:hypothetical protein
LDEECRGQTARAGPGPPVIDAGGLVTLSESPGDPPSQLFSLVALRTANPVRQCGRSVPRGGRRLKSV